MRYSRRRKSFVIAALLAGLASAASAQFIGRTVTVSQLPACNGTRQVAVVTDATNATTLGAGGGSATVWVTCASGSWAIATIAAVTDLSAYLPVSGTTAAPIVIQNSGAGNDGTFAVIDDLILTGNDWLPTFVATAVLTAPTFSIVASTSLLFTTPKVSASGVIERAVTNVTVADDAAGTKPTGAIPITTDYATCTCNDATGCTMSIAEPTVTSGYGRSLTIVSIGTGNCEFADSAGVTEIGSAVVLEPTSVLALVYANAAWHRLSTADNVP